MGKHGQIRCNPWLLGAQADEHLSSRPTSSPPRPQPSTATRQRPRTPFLPFYSPGCCFSSLFFVYILSLFFTQHPRRSCVEPISPWTAMLATKPTDDQTPRPVSTFQSRRKGPPAALRIHAPVQNPPIALMLDDANSTASASSSNASSATSDSDSVLPFARSDKPRSMRNTKRLSLVLPSAQDNQSSNSLPLASDPDITPSDDASQPSSSSSACRRRPSVISLPPSRGATRLHRKDEDESPTIPYLDGPVQILPGIWLGSEDNARDWDGLLKRGIRSILNVAREVNSPFDANGLTTALRPFVSAPDLKEKSRDSQSTFHPAHGPSGRPAMHYLKLPWSHGQKNLVHEGFVDAMAFVDSALERGDGVLVQCVHLIYRGVNISSHPILAVNVVFRDRRRWSLPSLCAQQRSSYHLFLQMFGV